MFIGGGGGVGGGGEGSDRRIWTNSLSDYRSICLKCSEFRIHELVVEKECETISSEFRRQNCVRVLKFAILISNKPLL